MKILKKLPRIFLAIVAWFLVFLGIVMVFLGVSEAVVDNYARVLPSYPKEDLSEVLAKEFWTEADYDFLYHQTGVGKSALEELKGKNERILKFQEALYYEGELMHSLAAFTTPHDYLKDYDAPLIPLHDGDVIVSSTCHTFGWRNGHSALIVDGAYGLTLESYSPGYDSSIGNVTWFRSAANFIVLRLKDATKEERAEIAQNALLTLKDVPYSLTVGIFSPKDQGESIQATHCSHLVWQAYKLFGYDIDADGGPVCTSRDISMCDLFEVVQVYGFDPDKLW